MNAMWGQNHKGGRHDEESRHHPRFIVGSLCLRLFFSAGRLWPGRQPGAIQGTLTDPSGAAVPGVEVTATNVATARSVKAVSSDTGFYSIEALLAGDYDITAQLSGFKCSKKDRK